MKIIDVNKNNFKEEVLESKIPVLVDFNADWCGPCKMIRPILEGIASEHDEYKIVSINVDNEEKLAEEYNVFSIPCLVLFKDGAEVNRSIGLIPKEQIESMFGGN